MLTYFSNAACNGKRPGHLSSLRNYPRTVLVAKLLAERDVARFIVAPSGYGKTSVALEYAETVFGFHHVFWLNGKSPCFIRDLDNQTLFSELSRLDRDSFLVVIEDVPLLHAARAEKLAGQIDELLGAGNEVIVTCEPTYDAFSQMTDRVLLGGRDLLVRDEELAKAAGALAWALPSPGPVASQDRVAALVWGTDAPGAAQAAFLRAAVGEELPSEMMLAMFVLITLGFGDIDEVEGFFAVDPELLQLLNRSYPHLGINLLEGTFRTANFGVDALAGAFLERLPVLAMRSEHASGDALACALADALVARKQGARACELVRKFTSRACRVSWLARQGDALIDDCCLTEASSVYRSLEAARLDAALHAGEALRCALLQSDAAACVAARRCAGDERIELRLAGALLLAGLAQGSAGEAALVELERLAVEGREGLDTDLAATDGQLDAGNAGAPPSPWLHLGDLCGAADVMLARDGSPSRGVRAWLAAFGGAEGRLGPVAFLCAAWLARRWLGEHARGGKRASGLSAGASPKASGGLSAYRKMCARISAATPCSGGAGSIGLPEALAVNALDAVWRHGETGAPVFDEALVRESAFKSGLLAEQRAARRRELGEALDARLGSSGARAVSRRPPILTVNMLGGMEVSVGGNKVSPDAFKRQKNRVLLALLVLNKGGEISRDKLMDMLYPDSEYDAARKNLDSTWCSVKKALKLPDGSCPYLIRRNKSLAIDASLLASDALELEEVCRMLLFNQPGQGGWSHLVKRVEDVFAGDLLPGDADDRALDRPRMEMRARLVDALVAASLSLVRSGQAQQGLWFAQAALRRDDSREDVYAALMRAQIAALQRTAALHTYFNCRKMLSEGLGIDPAREIVQLYNSIIDADGVPA